MRRSVTARPLAGRVGRGRPIRSRPGVRPAAGRALLLLGLVLGGLAGSARAQVTIYHVAVDGSDQAGDGSEDAPWATIGHALLQLPDEPNLIVLVGEGDYAIEGSAAPDSGWARRFQFPVTLRAATRYRARLSPAVGESIQISGARLSLGGFHVPRREPAAWALAPALVHLTGEQLRVTDCVFGHPYTDVGSQVSIQEGARDVRIDNSLFGEAGPLDGVALRIADAERVQVTGNVFANEPLDDSGWAGSVMIHAGYRYGIDDSLRPGRTRDLRIERNVFLDRSTGNAAMITLGEAPPDPGTPPLAQGVRIESNLFLARPDSLHLGLLEINDAADVQLRANTIRSPIAYPFHAFSEASVDALALHNNLIADPSGQWLGPPDASDPGAITYHNNLYWSAGQRLDAERILRLDPSAVVADPILPPIDLPERIPFPSDSEPTSALFARFARLAELAAGSPAIDRADGAHMPLLDLSGRPRGVPDIGALEHRPPPPSPTSSPTPSPSPSPTDSPLPWRLHLPFLTATSEL